MSLARSWGWRQSDLLGKTAEWQNDTRKCHFGRLCAKTSEIAKEKHENWEVAGRQGFEPRYRGPEPRVLPLDDLPVPVAMLCAVRTVDYSIAPGTGPSRVAASLNGSRSTHVRIYGRLSVPIICSGFEPIAFS